jgi:tRNA uridine 5-carboxymethylaminomethyl modification enzyme
MRPADSTSVPADVVNPLLASAESAPTTQTVKLVDLARRQNIELLSLFRAAGVGSDLPLEAVVTAELQIKYAGYFARERTAADKMRRMGAFPLETDLPYELMRSLSLEARQKLAERRPLTLAQASGIPGVGPNDLQNLVLEVERHRRRVATSAGETS